MRSPSCSALSGAVRRTSSSMRASSSARRAVELALHVGRELGEARVGEQLRVHAAKRRSRLRPRGSIAKAALAVQQQIEAAVGEPLALDDPARAADLEDRRAVLHRVLVAADQHHADHLVARERGLGHRAVARLEDVQRQVRSGKQHHARQREDREASWETRRRRRCRSSAQVILLRPPPEPDVDRAGARGTRTRDRATAPARRAARERVRSAAALDRARERTRAGVATASATRTGASASACTSCARPTC